MASPEAERRADARHSWLLPDFKLSGHEHEPLLVNASAGGACLWMPELPAVGDTAKRLLHLRHGQREHSVHAGVKWTRPFISSSRPGNDPMPIGWLVGLAFTKKSSLPFRALDSGDEIKVALLPEIGIHELARPTNDPVIQPVASGLLLDDASAARLHDVTETLLPVLAKNFVEVNLVLTRDRLEISAPFRSLKELDEIDRGRSNSGEATARGRRRATPKGTGERKTIAKASDLRPRTASAAAQVMSVKGGSTVSDIAEHLDAQPVSPPLARPRSRRLALVAVAAGVAVVIGSGVFRVIHSRSPESSAVQRTGQEQREIPQWAQGLNPGYVNGWIKVKDKFGITDNAARSLVDLVSNNDKYSPGQSMHDLSANPELVARALDIIATAKIARPQMLESLKRDLQAKFENGVRFPDEAPGERYYSNLDPMLYKNMVVLAIVEQLDRHESESSVKDLLAELQRHRQLVAEKTN